jgi:predicted ferric reductase
MTPAGLLSPTYTSRRSPARRLLRSGPAVLEALATPHGIKRYLELVRPTRSLGDHRAQLIALRRQSAHSVTITLRPDERWSGFRVGQFVRLTLEIAGVRETRCYSPACAEQVDGERTGREIEITVRSHPAGTVSGYLNGHARPGMIVGLSAAEGDFVLPRVRPERLLLISSGSGITPVMSRTTSCFRCCRAPRRRSCSPATQPPTSYATCGRLRPSSAATSPTAPSSSPRRRRPRRPAAVVLPPAARLG